MPGKPKFLADPCLGAITINDLEYQILNLKIFQRLRWLRQLPSVIFLFHSADHTRFSHSIGTMHIASLYADSIYTLNNYTSIFTKEVSEGELAEKEKKLDEMKSFIRLAGLLHDIAHGIFSHIYDEIVYKHEELLRRKKVEEYSHDSHCHEIIKNHLPEKLKELNGHHEIGLNDAIESAKLGSYSIEEIMEKVSNILNKQDRLAYNIVQGPLGADRLDYLVRDSYILGAGYGKVRLDRLTSYVRPWNGHLCYSVKVFDEVHSALMNRFYMYKDIYFHKTVRAADILLRQLLEHTVEPLELIDRTLNLKKFEELNESTFFGEIITRAMDSPEILKEKPAEISEGDFKEWLDRYIKDEADFKDADFSNKLSNELKKSIKLYKAREFLERIFSRRLYKAVWDEVILYDAPPERLADIAETTKSREYINKYAEKKGEKCPPLYVDTPYKFPSYLFDPNELQNSGVFLYDEKKIEGGKKGNDELNPGGIFDFDGYAFHLGYVPIGKAYQIIRIYTTLEGRKKLKEDGLPVKTQSDIISEKISKSKKTDTRY